MMNASTYTHYYIVYTVIFFVGFPSLWPSIELSANIDTTELTLLEPLVVVDRVEERIHRVPGRPDNDVMGLLKGSPEMISRKYVIFVAVVHEGDVVEGIAAEGVVHLHDCEHAPGNDFLVHAGRQGSDNQVVTDDTILE